MTERCRYCGGPNWPSGHDCHPTVERLKELLEQADRDVARYRRDAEMLETAWRAYHSAISRFFENQKGR